jgi:hypothetical protein
MIPRQAQDDPLTGSGEFLDPGFAAIRESARLVLFETGYPEYPVSTHGGTLFLVSHGGRTYGVTAKHNLQDFEWRQLQVTSRRNSTLSCDIAAAYFASEPEGAAVGSDILDIAVVEFPEDITDAFFEHTAYDLSKVVAGTFKGDSLIVYGAPAEKTLIKNAHIKTGFAKLEFVDNGRWTDDPALRSAIAQWIKPEFAELNGCSGAPVYNVTRGGLAGMMVRGNLNSDGSVKGHYIDAADIARVVDSVSRGVKYDRYEKQVIVSVTKGYVPMDEPPSRR